MASTEHHLPIKSYLSPNCCLLPKAAYPANTTFRSKQGVEQVLSRIGPPIGLEKSQIMILQLFFFFRARIASLSILLKGTNNIKPSQRRGYTVYGPLTFLFFILQNWSCVESHLPFVKKKKDYSSSCLILEATHIQGLFGKLHSPQAKPISLVLHVMNSGILVCFLQTNQ